MYAVLDIAGKQFKVTENQKLITPKIGKKDDTVEIDKVFLFEDSAGLCEIGKPTLNNIKVTVKVLEFFRDKKIIVFKKKRRKGYKKKQGHRQGLNKVLIEKIIKNGS